MSLHSMVLHQRREIDIEDINDEINTFLKRKYAADLLSENFVCDKSNLNENINALSEELYLLGIHLAKDTSSNEDTVISLCNIIWTLLTQYRKLNTKAVTCENNIKKLEQNNEILFKTNKKLKNEIEANKVEIATLNVSNSKLKSKIEVCNRDILQLKTESERLRKVGASMEMRAKKEVNRAKVQMDNLQNKFRGQCGTFVSKEKNENDIIVNLKKKEMEYKEQISNLKKENDKLVHEVLNMKETIVLLKYEHTNN